MARTVNERTHTAKRNDILAAAQRLIYTRGYVQMTIQDILDDLQISKGAFYHYFDSKRALLEALIVHLQDERAQNLLPVVRDPNLPALEKLRRFFTEIVRWRTERKDFLLALLRIWHADDNAIVRQKVRATMLKQLPALLAEIIRQGVREGTVATPYPEQMASVVVLLRMGLSEALAELLLDFDPQINDIALLASTIAAYTDAIERVLRIPEGCLKVSDAEVLNAWFD